MYIDAILKFVDKIEADSVLLAKGLMEEVERDVYEELPPVAVEEKQAVETAKAELIAAEEAVAAKLEPIDANLEPVEVEPTKL